MTSQVGIAQLCRELNKKMKPGANSVNLYFHLLSSVSGKEGKSSVITQERRLTDTAERWKLLKKIHNINKS